MNPSENKNGPLATGASVALHLGDVRRVPERSLALWHSAGRDFEEHRDHLRSPAARTSVLASVIIHPPVAMRSTLPLLVYLILATSPAAAQTSSAPSPELPSVTLPAELDRVLRDYERAWKAGDAPALAALFAADGFILQNGRAPVRGRTAIARAYAGQAGGALRLRALGYATADTVGYIVGAYGYGDTPGDMGKYTLTLRRSRGGAWEIFSDMDNGNAPRRSAPSPAPPE